MSKPGTLIPNQKRNSKIGVLSKYECLDVGILWAPVVLSYALCG